MEVGGRKLKTLKIKEVTAAECFSEILKLEGDKRSGGGRNGSKLLGKKMRSFRMY